MKNPKEAFQELLTMLMLDCNRRIKNIPGAVVEHFSSDSETRKSLQELKSDDLLDTRNETAKDWCYFSKSFRRK